MSIGYKIKKFYAKIRKKIKTQKKDFGSLSESQIKYIEIATACIMDNNSKLYAHPKNGEIQIQLPHVFLTISNENSFYECDVVYHGDKVSTSDKVIFDSEGLEHIIVKFNKEIERRMKRNVNNRDNVVHKHLNQILSVVVKPS
jgi:hypothetical protein